MKLQNALILFLILFGGAAQADLYKHVDTNTGAVQYTNQMIPGAVRMGSGDTLSEIAIGACAKTATVLATEEDVIAEKARIAQCEKEREARAVVTRKRRAADSAALNKSYPGACRQVSAGGWMCVPRVGMRVDRFQDVLGLSQLGFTEDEKGKLDRWSANGCQAMARGVTIVSVKC